jgi:hypothetical protein
MKVVVNPSDNNPSEVVFRKGLALEAKHPKSIIIRGTLQAPFQFIDSKKVKLNKHEDHHLRIFKDIGKLELHLHDTDPFTEHVITGELTKDSVIQQFKINTDARWTVAAFLKFLKTMRYYFPNKEQHTALVASLQKWSVNVERVIKDHNDNTGNTLLMLETKISGIDLVTKFQIEVPIFQGYSNHKFTVEIGFDAKATSVDLYLISDELIELEIGVREKIITDELKKFSEWGFSKIVIS